MGGSRIAWATRVSLTSVPFTAGENLERLEIWKRTQQVEGEHRHVQRVDYAPSPKGRRSPMETAKQAQTPSALVLNGVEQSSLSRVSPQGEARVHLKLAVDAKLRALREAQHVTDAAIGSYLSPASTPAG